MGDLGTRRVLLVEDDEPIREAVEEVLKDEGCVVVSTATLVEARAALSSRAAFDVMLLDLMLEDGSGEELLEELKAKATRVPTVIMSASTRAQATAQAFGAELLRKPFEIETLLACVETAMRKKT
jgi:DNA-binding response OmpR family regulator